MLIAILSHTPIRVWALLAAWLALGLWSMAPGFVAQPVAALLWLLTLVAFAWLGRRLPRPAAARWLAEEDRLFLPGSWVPLLLIVCIFGLRYAVGVGQGLHPQWRNLAQVQWPLAAAFGALSGIFLGRALALRSVARPA